MPDTGDDWGWGYAPVAGDRCMAIWPEDGLPYPAVVDSVGESACEVTFDEDGTTYGPAA